MKKMLAKMETKYVNIHEGKQKLQQDRDTFVQFIQLVFEGPMLEEVLLPDDKIGSYDIEHMRQFWILQKARNEQSVMIENESLKD